MIATQKKYWFYLEPYTFLFRGKDNAVIYNSLDSTYIPCPKGKAIDNVINSLDAKGSGYTTEITNKELTNLELLSFVENIRNSFSGDILDSSIYPQKPFIFKPILRLRDNFHILRNEEQNKFFNENILKYLKEVSLYINSSCNQICTHCNHYYKQFPFCTKSETTNTLLLEECISILDHLENSGTNLVKIMGGNIFNYQDIQKLSVILNSYKFKKQFYYHYKNVPSDNFPLIIDENVSFCILVEASTFDKEQLLKSLNRFSSELVELFFTICSEEDYFRVEDFMMENPSYRVSVKPFFDGNNYEFFELNVYNNLEDILDIPVDKKSIFRRQVTNENFFGKLVIMPNGDVYSSLNNPVLGNVYTDTLNKIVFNEINTSHSWFKTRDNNGCRSCCNRYLCPSPSDYEQVLNRDNLCHISAI